MSAPGGRRLLAAAIAGLGIACGALAAGQPDPAVWDAILSARVRDGGFDYRGTSGQDRKRLAAYLSNLGDARPTEMAEGEREAFSINAYNAVAVSIVLDHLPVASIRDIEGAFSSIRKKIGGEMLTLDDVENRLREANDARIHFAIVCASKSCAPLAPKAYRAASLSTDLEAQGRAFLRDPGKNIVDPVHGRLALSRIFEWNRREFERDAGTLAAYAARFAPRAVADWLKTWHNPPEFLPYDWALNQP